MSGASLGAARSWAQTRDPPMREFAPSGDCKREKRRRGPRQAAARSHCRVTGAGAESDGLMEIVLRASSFLLSDRAAFMAARVSFKEILF
jgi:hypothetical protein